MTENAQGRAGRGASAICGWWPTALADAHDAVQDAWLRLSRAGKDEVENLGGWLTTIVARVCPNMLRARTTQREESFELHLPDPIISVDGKPQPEDEALLADSVGRVLLVYTARRIV